jgi:hypothetical protein
MRNIFKTLRRSRNEEDDGYDWVLEREENRATHRLPEAAALPIETWTADPITDRELLDELNPTIIIPKIVPDGPEAAFIALSFNDVDAKCMASKVLRTTRSPEVVLAGLWEYVSRHPAAV